MTRALSTVDALAVGSGALDLTLYARPDAVGGQVGYEHRITEGLSATATGWAGSTNASGDWSPDFGVTAGVRWRF